MRVVLAPDSFKGSASAVEVVAALSRGWALERPEDELIPVPLADGGEGTLDVLAASDPGATWQTGRVTGPDGAPVDARWLLLSDGTAGVELARSSGLPLMGTLDAVHATTAGLGEQLLAAVRHPRTRRVLVALGGSATTDGGAGALQALGARLVDGSGSEVGPGGAALRELRQLDRSGLVEPPAGGVRCLVDVTAPLLGPVGAAAQFGPQKGASSDDVAVLEAALRRYAEVVGGAPDQPGAGAAGGTAFGLATVWGARLVPGAPEVAQAAGLPRLLDDADLVVTGEGRFDAQSFGGKVVGHVLVQASALGTPQMIVAGSVAVAPPSTVVASADLTRLAGGLDAALADPHRWLVEAGSRLATQATSHISINSGTLATQRSHP
jgi:glycerate kinase